MRCGLLSGRRSFFDWAFKIADHCGQGGWVSFLGLAYPFGIDFDECAGPAGLAGDTLAGSGNHGRYSHLLTVDKIRLHGSNGIDIQHRDTATHRNSCCLGVENNGSVFRDFPPHQSEDAFTDVDY